MALQGDRNEESNNINSAEHCGRAVTGTRSTDACVVAADTAFRHRPYGYTKCIIE